jgi:hypothetical protein
LAELVGAAAPQLPGTLHVLAQLDVQAEAPTERRRILAFGDLLGHVHCLIEVGVHDLARERRQHRAPQDGPGEEHRHRRHQRQEQRELEAQAHVDLGTM